MDHQNLPEQIDAIKREFHRDYEEWLEKRSKREASRNEDHSAGLTGEISTGGGGGTSGRPSKPGREKTESDPPKDRDIRGFQNEILALKHFLLKKKDSEQFKTLAVVGRHGVGKTALCQTVFNNEAVQKEYIPRIWVSMYEEEEQENGNPKMAIVKRLLKNLGVEQETLNCIKHDAKDVFAIDVEKGKEGKEAFEKEELSRLLYVLHMNLWGKKYLIILDDVREEDEWNERLDEETSKDKEWETHLSRGFPKGFGGRVIFTSRDEVLAMKLVGKEENLHRLYPLSDPDSLWKVYVDAEKEFKNIDVRPRNPRKSQEELMNKSGGIPLVARMMGKIEPVVKKDEQTPSEQPDGGTTESSRGKADQKISEQEGTDEMKTTAKE